MSNNPYQHLPPQNYWRSGVVQYAESLQDYPELWTGKFPITPQDSVITVGSCFAQHISKWIKQNGFSWLDAEPAPSGWSEHDLESNGYGIFSFRVGNIYTAALLKQWVFQALKKMPVLDEDICEGNRYYDPFRPLIPKNGFGSRDALQEARLHTVESIANALKKADVFIFTLGLTEAWRHASGYVYPVCPGTLRGQFDATLHRFVNFSYDQIRQDLMDVFAAIRAINPGIRFLLTVSPVPLTATASHAHVLVATTYSKAVLRAVAGDLAKQLEDVDYFPSYELIAQFPSRGRYYEDNLRSIKPEGVQFVMNHFARGIGLIDSHLSSPHSATPAGLKSRKSPACTVEEYCEDVLLEEWLPDRTAPESAPDMQVFLLGDSHLDATGAALRALGIPNEGGMIMRGHVWAAGDFAIDAAEILVPLDGPQSRQRWQQTLSALRASKAHPKYLITNVGLQTNVNIPNLVSWAQQQNRDTISAAEIVQFFQTTNAKHLQLIQAAQAHGLKCLIITDPPTQSLNPGFEPWIPLLAHYELVACSVFEAMGCLTLNVRSLLGAPLPVQYFSSQRLGEGPDWVHGSPEYYAGLATWIKAKLESASKSITQ